MQSGKSRFARFKLKKRIQAFREITKTALKDAGKEDMEGSKYLFAMFDQAEVEVRQGKFRTLRILLEIVESAQAKQAEQKKFENTETRFEGVSEVVHNGTEI